MFAPLVPQQNLTERQFNTQLTEVNKHLAKALPHVLRHCQDARHIVVEEGILLLKD